MQSLNVSTRFKWIDRRHFNIHIISHITHQGLKKASLKKIEAQIRLLRRNSSKKIFEDKIEKFKILSHLREIGYPEDLI